MQQIILILPLLWICLAGVFFTKLKLIPKDAYLYLNRYVIYVATPALTISSLLETDVNNLSKYPIFSLVNAVAFVIFSLVLFLILNQSRIKYETLGSIFYTSMSGNVIYFGYPIILSLLGKEHFAFAVIWIATTLQISDTVIALILTIKKGGSVSISKIIKNIFTNPLIVSTLIGFALFFIYISLPKTLPDWMMQIQLYSVNPIMSMLSKIASTNATIALFSLGVYLSSHFKINTFKYSIIASFIKLMLLPAFIFFIVFFVFKLDRVAAETSVILATMPSAVFTIIASDVYNYDKNQTSNTVMLTSVLFIATLSFWLWAMSLVI
jgi:predicted permease